MPEKIVVILGDTEVARYTLDKDEVSIGRAEQNDIRVNNQSVSRRHALIRREKGRYYLLDLESANGSFLNGTRTTHSEIFNNDMIGVGNHVLHFLAPPHPCPVPQATLAVPPQTPGPPSLPTGSGKEFRAGVVTPNTVALWVGLAVLWVFVAGILESEKSQANAFLLGYWQVVAALSFFCIGCVASAWISKPPRPEHFLHEFTPSRGYAGFWKRFAAFFIDALVLIVPGLMLQGIIGALFAPPSDDEVSALRSLLWAYCMTQLAVIAMWWLYYSLMESSMWQATLGKKALGIVVVDSNGNRLTWGRATGRHFGKIISAIPMSIGFLLAAFTQKKQALHDMMAGTLVVNVGTAEAETRVKPGAATCWLWAVSDTLDKANLYAACRFLKRNLVRTVLVSCGFLKRNLVTSIGLGVLLLLAASLTMNVVLLRKVVSIERDVSRTKRDVSSIESDVSSIELNVSSIESDVSSIELNVSSIESDVSSIESDVSSVKEGVSSIESDVSTININLIDIYRAVRRP
jgi:uncharacterized RDD family membrane protein YckC